MVWFTVVNLLPTMHGMNQWRTLKFCSEVGGSTNSFEDRENGDLGAVDPLIMGSRGSYNLVQEMTFHIKKFLNF